MTHIGATKQDRPRKKRKLADPFVGASRRCVTIRNDNVDDEPWMRRMRLRKRRRNVLFLVDKLIHLLQVVCLKLTFILCKVD